MDGHYGGLTRIKLMPEELDISCDCPYPGTGCRNGVAEAPNVRDLPALPLKMDLYPFQKKTCSSDSTRPGFLLVMKRVWVKPFRPLACVYSKRKFLDFQTNK